MNNETADRLPDPRGFELLSCRPARRRGFTQVAMATFRYGSLVGLVGELHEKNGRYWVQLPHGLKWQTADAANRFNTLALTALGRFHPNLFQQQPPTGETLEDRLHARLGGKSQY